METNRALFLGLVLLLLAVVDFSLADSKGNKSTNTGSDPQLSDTNSSKEKADVLNLSSNSVGVDEEKKNEGDTLNKSKEGIDDDVNKSNSGTQSGSQENNSVDNGKGDKGEKLLKKNDDDHNKGENSSGGSESQDVPNKKKDEGESKVHLTPPRKDGSHAEECDPSNKCTDEENKLVACVRVPGNDSPSPDFSLLIQNKGKGPLSVTISAPDFVQLEETKIQLQEKEDKKVKVSISNGGSKKPIVLTAGNGRCNLDIGDLIAHNFEKQFDKSPKTSHINFMARAPTIAVMSFAALLMLASGWMCISCRRKQFSKGGSKYQKLDMELPVSGGAKMESEINEGWDNNWGDDWDDEEAPKTPLMPVTPSLSAKGLASRRLSKEGWKD